MLLKIKILLFFLADRLAPTVHVSQRPVIPPVQTGHRPFNPGMVLAPFGVGAFTFRATASKADLGLALPTRGVLTAAAISPTEVHDQGW